MLNDTITNCIPNVSITNNEEYVRFMSKRNVGEKEAFQVYHGWLSITPALLGFILTIIFFAAVVRAIRQRRVSRKAYVLLLNRASGDLFACVVAFTIIAHALTADKINRTFMQIMDVLFIGTFWSSMVSYVSLGVLKLYAASRPLEYRHNVTLQRCIKLSVLSWLVFIVYVAYALGSVAATKIECLQRITGCKVETCTRYMYWTRNFLNVAVYFFTIICFLMTVLFIRRAQAFADSFHKKSTKGARKRSTLSRFPMWKIALNVATFACFHSFYMIWSLWRITDKDPCYFMLNFVPMARLLGIIRFALLLRIVVDPILSFATDFQVRRSVLELFGASARIAPIDSKRTVRSTMPDEQDVATESTSPIRSAGDSRA